jgi:DNA-binding beta-propeller fold protein YncE
MFVPPVRRVAFALAVLVLAAMGMGRAQAGPAGFRLLKEIPIPGPGGWDYLTVDDGARRLYVSHATEVVVIDLKTMSVLGTIPDTLGVHGIALAPDLGRAFVSNGREAKVSIVDTFTLKTLSKVDTGENPDAILYEPKHKEVYAFNGRGKSATVFQAATGKPVATIALPGKPEFAVEDAEIGRIYNNIEDRNVVAVIDAGKHEVVATWPIAPGEAASGMAIDLAHHRLFLGCENQMMVVMDSRSGKVVATVPIGKGVDANAYDPATGLAFSSNGEGNVTIVKEVKPDKFKIIQTLTTEPRSRTMALDPRTHVIYVPAAGFEPAPPPTTEHPRPRPQVIPGSMRVLVYGTR